MTTTWPRYRSSCEFLGEDGQECHGYNLDHSCGHIDNEGKVVGTYPGHGHCHDIAPPPPPHQGESAPALPAKTKKEGKREHRGEREGRGESRERSRRQEEADCVDCNNAPNGGVAPMEAESGYNTGSRSRDNIAESGYSTGTRNRDNIGESGYSTGTRQSRGDPPGKETDQIQYIDADNCQVPVSAIEPVPMSGLDQQYSTIHKSPSRRKSRGPKSQQGTMDRGTMDRGTMERSRDMESCDTMDTMPLTPASFAGLDQRDLEERPLTQCLTPRMNKATVYDDPPEKTSLFITCSALYAFLLVIICLAFLTSEVVTDGSPLHYYEGFFTYLYLVSILFFIYVICYLLHESTCCRSEPEPTAYFQTDTMSKCGLDYAGLQEGYPHCLTKLKKYKTSENEQSHGSFFLRVGGLAFGLGTMVYNGLEFGSWFEIPWDSPCYQAVRGINPFLQMIFTFMQMYFIFMNARLNIQRFQCLARFGLMHIVATNLCVWIRTIFKEGIKDVAAYRVERGEGYSQDYMIKEGYSILRRKFGNDSFWIHGPYHYIMKAIFQGEGVYRAFNIYPVTDISSHMRPQMTSTTRAPPPFNPAYPIYPGYEPGPGYQRPGFNNIPGFNASRPDLVGPNRDLTVDLLHEVQNFTCGRQDLMGDIVKRSAPYLYPFLIEFSLIGAAVLAVMWARTGTNPRYWGDDENDRVSVTSRKMITYTRVDCVGSSKGLFFGLLVFIAALICLILFFVLIDHGNPDVHQLAVFLADISHASIMILATLAILLGFCRVRKLKFHGEEESVLSDVLLKLSACGVFTYSTFSIIAGCLGDYRKMPNLVIMVTGIIAIIQVVIQLLFIPDVGRRRIHTAEQDRSKPGRQIVTFLLICNLAIWVIYTFEIQKVNESPVQIEFFGYQPWVIIQKLTLPLCIFFRFHSTVVLAEIWKNSYKTKLID